MSSLVKRKTLILITSEMSSGNMLKKMMVPSELPLAKFRKYYHSVLTTEEKKIPIDMGMDPWSIEGLKYAGDCRRYKIKLGNKIDN